MTSGLIADIGGTNLRFALVENGRIVREQTLNWSAPPSISVAARTFLGSDRPTRAALAIAAQVTGSDILHMPNVANADGFGWSFSLRQLQDELELDRLDVFNDFTAVALAVPELSPADRIQIGEGPAAPLPGRTIGVLGAGTGLGISGLVWSGDGYTALTTEGGHATMPAGDDHEAEILALLRKQYGHVSAERVLSGAGLVNLHNSLMLLDRREPVPRTPAEITTLALTGDDPFCLQATELFCALLGSVAGNLALTLGAFGGVYVAGGIVPKILPIFLRSRFRQRFTDKGRYQAYLSAIPTYVVTHPQPAFAGLIGVLAHPRV